MNPHHLELFYHVAKAKGITRAVRQMPYGIQQPSVSAQVNALERFLGVTLFQRHPFKLTPAGEELYQFVEPFFGRMADVREKLRGAGQLRVGASPIIFRDYLLPVFASLRRQFPRMSMMLRATNQPELIDAIEHDELDVVISLIPDKPNVALQSVEIFSLPLILLVAKSSPVLSAADLWKNKPVREPLISLPPNEMISQKFQDTLVRLGVSWLPTIEMDSLELIERYAEEGYGIGLSVRVPQKKLHSRIRVLELPGFPELVLGLIYRTGSSPNADLQKAFIEEVKRHAGGQVVNYLQQTRATARGAVH